MKNVRYLHVELNKTHLDSERNPMYDFILVVLPTKDTDTYAYIKSRTEVEGYMNFREPVSSNFKSFISFNFEV